MLGPAPGVPVEWAKARYDETDPEQGPGTQVTLGAVGIFRFVKVWLPEQPLKLYSTASVVRVSSGDTVKVTAPPCAVVPLHWPTLRDEDGDGVTGVPPHAEISTAASAIGSSPVLTGTDRLAAPRRARDFVRMVHLVCNWCGQVDDAGGRLRLACANSRTRVHEHPADATSAAHNIQQRRSNRRKPGCADRRSGRSAQHAQQILERVHVNRLHQVRVEADQCIEQDRDMILALGFIATSGRSRSLSACPLTSLGSAAGARGQRSPGPSSASTRCQAPPCSTRVLQPCMARSALVAWRPQCIPHVNFH